MKRIVLLVSTFGYVGFFPIAPGTAGSAAALVLYAVLRWIGSPAAEFATIAVVLALGVWAGTRSEALLGGTDPGPVVIDEVLGMLITLAGMPLSLTGVLLGFVCFRIFDIVKPFPARRLEDAPGGWGIMLDDAAAGVYGQVALRLLVWVWPAWMVA
ncbi:MAG TPA: phosphatidylglycerophosphatase A [Vicinamibacterales bacterium]|nr:phosphatidylglycerophosphatase A [Vicinamibacterales bacterium]